jgi:hypothetical protein
MATKTRIANKTAWALEDMIALNAEARRYLDVALKRLEERTMDPILLAALGRVSNALAKSDVKAREARQGDYSDDRTHGD